MMSHLSRRERIIVGAVVLLAWTLGGFFFVVQPMIERNQAVAAAVPKRERLLLERRETVASRDEILRDLEAKNADLDRVSSRFLTAATPAIAAAELQKIAKEMASAASTEIRSEQILSPVEHGELLEIPIQIAVSGEIRQLVDLLERLERAPKLLTVHDLKIRVVNISQPKELLATLAVSGFMLHGKVKS